MADITNQILTMPASRAPLSLLSVDRAVSDMRRGHFVVVSAGGIALLVRLVVTKKTRKK